MDVLIFHNDYGKFLEWFYRERPELRNGPHEEQLEARRNTLFSGSSLFYERHLEELGYDAATVYATNEHLQKAWLRDEGNAGTEPASARESLIRRAVAAGRYVSDVVPFRLRPLAARILGEEYLEPEWFREVISRQLEHYRPRVVLNKGMFVDGAFLDDHREHFETLVGTAGLPKHTREDLSPYDAVVAHMTALREPFRPADVPTTVIHHAFEPAVRDRVGVPAEPDIPVSFVGSLGKRHSRRIRLVEKLCRETPIQVWAPTVDHLPGDSPIHSRYQGQAWGKQMLEILARSKITVNRHIDTATNVVGNVRLFEATGMGTLLVTDEKPNLEALFEPGREVLTYGSLSECSGLVSEYLERTSDRRRIARAGRERTLTDHTYRRRMESLVEFLEGNGFLE